MQKMTSAPPTVNDAKGRVAQREAERQARSAEAMDQSNRAQMRLAKSIVMRVEAAKRRLSGLNVSEAVQVIEYANLQDRNILLLAESLGQNRAGVFVATSPVSPKLRQEYDDAVEGAPDPAPEPKPAAKAPKEKKQ
jgi:hypothetical protein